jgi:hypothetical protein
MPIIAGRHCSPGDPPIKCASSHQMRSACSHTSSLNGRKTLVWVIGSLLMHDVWTSRSYSGQAGARRKLTLLQAGAQDCRGVCIHNLMYSHRFTRTGCGAMGNVQR